VTSEGTTSDAATSVPLFSVLTPVYDPPAELLLAAIESVRAQSFDDWELICVDDCSSDPAVLEVLRSAAAADSRIRVIERAVNGHIVAASNDALDLARGTFVVLLDHDDLLVPDALEQVERVLRGEPEVDYVYSDEDKIDADGRLYDEFRKPPFSAETLRGHMYTCHLSVLRTSTVRTAGGFVRGTEGSQDHDLALRVTELARKVVHIPRVLYHWRAHEGSAAGNTEAKPYAWLNGRAAVQAHLDRTGIAGSVDLGPGRGTYRVTRRLDQSVRVSVVIPTRGVDALVRGEHRYFVVEAVRSLLARGGHANVDVVVVHDVETPAQVLDELDAVAGDRLELVPYDREFNFSEKCNLGVLASYGDVVVLLNDDVEITSDGFLTQLVAPLAEPGVGMTGANLTLPTTAVQHAGLALDDRLTELFPHGARRVVNPGPFLVRSHLRGLVGSHMAVNREVSGVTAAALAIRRSTFDEVGGLSEVFPVNFGDADLSLKVTGAGYRILWIADATACHFEARSRNPVVRAAEVKEFEKRWVLPHFDPFLPDQPRRPALLERPRVSYQ
jgi:glycosyltransferase involved in cell wall biosynthesis